MEKQRIQVRHPTPEFTAALDAAAKSCGLSVNAWVLMTLSHKLQEMGLFNKPKKAGKANGGK